MNTLKSYRKIALIEGISYLVLLILAMPLKYLFDFPQPVKYVGWAHGVLFIMYIALLLVCWVQYKWSILRVAGFFLASLIPFAPFVVEKRLQKDYGR
jgi:integral membrane protein